MLEVVGICFGVLPTALASFLSWEYPPEKVKFIFEGVARSDFFRVIIGGLLALARRSQFLQALANFRAVFEGVITLQCVSHNYPSSPFRAAAVALPPPPAAPPPPPPPAAATAAAAGRCP